jgi:Raf kinase inhibitor-like YbhB/YbcL family protein
MDHGARMKRVFHYVLSTLLFISHPVFAGIPTASLLTLTTNAFQKMMAMPTMYTCDGKNISPELSWTAAPTGTLTFALIIKDIDVPSNAFYHWIVYNIPSTVHELAQGGTLPSGSLIGKNSFNKEEYSGPCPPKSTAHHYVFSLYALDRKLGLSKGADGETVLNAIKGHILSQVDMTGIYSRWIE